MMFHMFDVWDVQDLFNTWTASCKSDLWKYIQENM